MAELFRAFYDSPVGILELTSTEKGLCGLYFMEHKPLPENPNDILQKTAGQLDEYFNGSRKKFNLPLDIQGTDFQKKVWNELLKIPFGSTKTYLDIALALGDRKTIRAVGLANGKNKISIIIPCHRVIGSDGSLTGFGGGLPRKKWLLEHEAKYVQGNLFE